MWSLKIFFFVFFLCFAIRHSVFPFCWGGGRPCHPPSCASAKLFIITCKLLIRKKLINNQNLNKTVIIIELLQLPTTVSNYYCYREGRTLFFGTSIKQQLQVNLLLTWSWLTRILELKLTSWIMPGKLYCQLIWKLGNKI